MARLGSTQFVLSPPIVGYSHRTDVQPEGCCSFVSNTPALVGSLNFYSWVCSLTLVYSCLVLRLCTYFRDGGGVYMEFEISSLYYALHLVSLCADRKRLLSLEHIKKT